jgi:hypothetical protein
MSGGRRRDRLRAIRGDEDAHAPTASRSTPARNPAPSPRKAFPAGSRRTGFLARGSSSPGPFPPRGSGRDRVRPPLQLRGSEGLPPSSLARLGSEASYDRGRELSMEKGRAPAMRRGSEGYRAPAEAAASRTIQARGRRPTYARRHAAVSRADVRAGRAPSPRTPETVNRPASRCLAVAPHARC